MGAIGAALLAQEEKENDGSGFKGFGVSELDYGVSSFECEACPYLCQIIQLSLDGQVLASWGGRCDLWQETLKPKV